MTDLSSAAQAVLDAFLNGYICSPEYNVAFESDRNGLAAALRAVADQVAPDDYYPPRTAYYPEAQAFVDGKECRNEDIRDQLLAIAAELEAQ